MPPIKHVQAPTGVLNISSALRRFNSPAKATATGEGEGEKLEEIRALMSTMVQQMQELPDAIKPSGTSGPAFGAPLSPTCCPGLNSHRFAA